MPKRKSDGTVYLIVKRLLVFFSAWEKTPVITVRKFVFLFYDAFLCAFKETT